jgi:hypothetical protein
LVRKEHTQHVPEKAVEPKPERVRPRFDEPHEKASSVQTGDGEISHEELERVLNGDEPER